MKGVGEGKTSPFLIMAKQTNKSLAQKEIKRIMRSFKYREKKYGITFDKENFLKRALGREAKVFSKRDIETLRDIKGSELYRFGTYQTHTGEIIKGYKTEDVVKDYKKAYKEARNIQREKERQEYYQQEFIPHETKRSANLDYLIELKNSSDDLIRGFLNYESWSHNSEWLRDKISDYAYRAISEFGKTCFAYVIEKAMSSGDLIKLKLEAYYHNFEAKIAEYLSPYFGGYEELRDIEEEMHEEAFTQTDYDESTNPYIY